MISSYAWYICGWIVPLETAGGDSGACSLYHLNNSQQVEN